MLVEGLGVGTETSIEEYIIGPANEITGETNEKGQVRLYGPEEGVSWIAKPVTRQSTLGIVSRQGSLANPSMLFVDPLVTLFGSVHENLPTTGSMSSILFPNTGSILNDAGSQVRTEQWDEEGQRDSEDYAPEGDTADSDDNLRSPLLSRQDSSTEKDSAHRGNSSIVSMMHNSSLINVGEEGALGIGGGWQLAYKWSEKVGKDGRMEGELQRVFLHPEGMVSSQRGSLVSIAGVDIPEEGEFVQAAALVSQAAVHSKDILGPHPDGLAAIHPSETVVKGPSCIDLFEAGVKRALIVGVGLQILQQVYKDGFVSLKFVLSMCL